MKEIAVSKSTGSDMNSPLKYMKQLDGLRAIAVLAVLWTHYLPEQYWLFGIYWGGFGVRLFFVLSGFLITGILLKCREYVTEGQQTSLLILRQFYIRRFLRIFPLYYAMLALTALIAIPSVRETITWHITYLSNVYFAIRGDFYGPVSHFWSLAVEEQFYLIWPWLILFLNKRYLFPGIVMAVFIAPMFRLTATLMGLNQVAIWVLTPSLLDTLCMGALLAYVIHQKPKITLFNKKIKNIFLFIGFFIMFLSCIITHEDPNSSFANIIYDIGNGLVFTCLVAAAAKGFQGFVGNILEFHPLVYLGKISYGIYLIHPFTPHILHKVIDRLHLSIPSSDLTIALLSTVVTIILATTSWFCWEKPINNLKKFFHYHDKIPRSSAN